jgi:hypothetical protein
LKNTTHFLALSLIVLCGTAGAAEADGVPNSYRIAVTCSGLVPWTGFYPAGSHLGLGPGYPGLYPPYQNLLPPYYFSCWFCPSCWTLPATKVVIVRAPSCCDEARRVLREQRMARTEQVAKVPPAIIVEGPKARRPLPGANADAAHPSGYSTTYRPHRYLQGKSYAVSYADALSQDPGLGIIVWKPKN